MKLLKSFKKKIEIFYLSFTIFVKYLQQYSNYVKMNVLLSRHVISNIQIFRKELQPKEKHQKILNNKS